MSTWIKDESQSPPVEGAIATDATATAYGSTYSDSSPAGQYMRSDHHSSATLKTTSNNKTNPRQKDFPSVSDNSPITTGITTSLPPLSNSGPSIPISSVPSLQRESHLSSTTAEPKPKRVRTSKPKVKTGCTNCKYDRLSWTLHCGVCSH